jgi:hypothetical protein
MNDVLDFIQNRIDQLTQLREEYQAEGDFEMDDYTAGAIDAYDIIRMKLEDKE